jgi:hypothetical protein
MSLPGRIEDVRSFRDDPDVKIRCCPLPSNPECGYARRICERLHRLSLAERGLWPGRVTLSSGMTPERPGATTLRFMADWVPIVSHRDFYDIPHVLVVRVGARLLLLESRFDESLDDYEPDFSVYELREDAELPDGSWDHLTHGLTRIASIPLGDAEFGHDHEGRYALRSDAVEALREAGL